MKKIALSILLALPFLAFAQQKDYIVTLQEDEYFSSDNSRLLGTSNGYEWKVVTEGSEEISAKVKWLYLPDGRKLDFSDKTKHIVNFYGEVLKAIHEAGRGSYAAYRVSYNDNKLGTYCIKKSYRQGIVHTDFFNYSLMGVTINSPASSFGKQEENYYHSPTKGMLGPLTREEARYVFFFSGGYANISKDSTLFVNGKKTLEDIAFAVFRDENNWYAFHWWNTEGKKVYVYTKKL